VNVWGAETGEELFTVGGQGVHVLSVAWSPDGTRLAAASSHGLTVWDADTGKELLPRSQARAGSMLAWSPDSKRLVTVRDDAVTVWTQRRKKNCSRLRDCWMRAGVRWRRALLKHRHRSRAWFSLLLCSGWGGRAGRACITSTLRR
jgi:WD40 repeat protein